MAHPEFRNGQTLRYVPSPTMGSEFLLVSHTDSLATEEGEERAGGQGRSRFCLP